jgi:hypothetical protein
MIFLARLLSRFFVRICDEQYGLFIHIFLRVLDASLCLFLKDNFGVVERARNSPADNLALQNPAEGSALLEPGSQFVGKVDGYLLHKYLHWFTSV